VEIPAPRWRVGAAETQLGGGGGKCAFYRDYTSSEMFPGKGSSGSQGSGPGRTHVPGELETLKNGRGLREGERRKGQRKGYDIEKKQRRKESRAFLRATIAGKYLLAVERKRSKV